MIPVSALRINRLTLSFPETLERDYQEYYFRDSLKVFRITFLFATVLYLIFGILDQNIEPGIRNTVIIIRYGIVVSSLLCVLLLSFFSFFKRLWQWFIFVAFIITGLGAIGIIIQAPGNNIYYAGIMLIFLAGYFFIRLRFLLASIAGLIILIALNATELLILEKPSENYNFHNFFLISTNIISMVVAYHMEFTYRRNFFLNHQLNRKKIELEQINRSLEKEVQLRTSELAASEEKFRTVFNHSGIGIAIVNTHRHFLIANQALCRFLGYEENELQGDIIRQITHPADFVNDQQYFQELIAGKRSIYEIEKRYIHKNGQVIWGRLTVSSVQIDASEDPFFIALVADINDQKQAQEALHNERLYFEQLFETAPVGIVLLDNDDICIDCNSEFTRLFQYTKNDAVGKPINELIVPADLKEEASGISNFIAGGKEFYHESIRKRKDGSNIPVAIIGKPVFAETGQVAIYGIYQDISERKKAEKELQRRLAFQECAVRVSSRFAATENPDKAIDESLADIGSLAQSDRAYLFQLSNDRQKLSNSHEWCAPGINAQIENLQNLPVDILPRWTQNFREGKNVIIENVAQLPTENDFEREFLEAQDIKSVMAIPLFIRNEFSGFIGFDYVKRFIEWSDSDLAILKVASEIIAYAIERKTVREALLYERDLLQALMDNIPDTIYFKDTESRFIRINRAQAGVLGIGNIEDAIGKTDFDFFEKEHAQEAFEDEQKIIQEGKPVIGKLEHFNTQDGWKWMSATKVPIKDQGKDIIGLVGVSHDVTRQKVAEDALRSSEQFLLRLSEITNLALKATNVPDLFQLLADQVHILLSSDISFITLWDEENQRTIPMAASGLISKMHIDYEILPGELTMTEAVIKVGKPIVEEDMENSKYVSRRIASLFPTKSLLALPLIVDDVRLGAVLIGFSRHHVFTKEEIEYGTLAANQIALIVSKTKMLEQLVRNQKELIRINAEKDKLFSVIAHDLRSPFTSFLGLTEIMTDESTQLSTEEMREFALAIQQSANGLYQLLENLLEWSRMQGGIIDFKLQDLNLHDIIVSNLNILQGAATRKQIEISNQVGKDIIVNGDHKMIRSITGNLLSNAIKFTERGGNVTIFAEHYDGWVRVKIKDTGVGISQDTMQKLFRIDAKVASRGTEGEPSSGLGLILCRDFVEKHGGKIWVESTPGKGSSFYFTLPAAATTQRG